VVRPLPPPPVEKKTKKKGGCKRGSLRRKSLLTQDELGKPNKLRLGMRKSTDKHDRVLLRNKGKGSGTFNALGKPSRKDKNARTDTENRSKSRGKKAWSVGQ